MLNQYLLNEYEINFFVTGIAIDAGTYTLIEGNLGRVTTMNSDIEISSELESLYFGITKYLNVGTRYTYLSSLLNKFLLNSIELNGNLTRLEDGIISQTDAYAYLGRRSDIRSIPIDIISDVNVNLGRVTQIAVDINCGTALCAHLVVFYDCYPRLWLNKKCKRCPVFP